MAAFTILKCLISIHFVLSFTNADMLIPGTLLILPPPGGYDFIGACLFVCMLACLLAGLCENHSPAIHKIQ